MKRLYQDLYIGIIAIWELKSNEMRYSHLNAFLIITFCNFVNFASVIILFAIVGVDDFGLFHDLYEFISNYQEVVVAIMLSVFGCSNYFLFLKSSNYKKLLYSYNKISKQKAKLTALVYLCISLLLPIGLIVIAIILLPS